MKMFERIIGTKDELTLHALGPITLLAALSLAVYNGSSLDLVFIAILGIFLSARLGLKGCAYTLILLGIDAVVKHGFFTEDHFWHLGIEGALATGFFITALSFENTRSASDSLLATAENRHAALQNLEDELVKVREASLAEQIAASEKIASLQKEIEDTGSEHASILILNEVLRKTTARHIAESESQAEKARDSQGQITFLSQQLQSAESELSRLKATEPLAIENANLMKELNAARVAREQTHLINETLAHLHAKVSRQAEEAQRQLGDAKEKQEIATQEAQRQLAALQERNNTATQEAQQKLVAFQEQHDTSTQELQKHLTSLNDEKQQLEQRCRALETSIQDAKKQITLLSNELSQKQRAPHLEEKVGQMQDHLNFAYEKIQTLANTELLYKQLKKQFSEKNEILHLTRSELFKTDTELKSLQLQFEETTLQVPEELGSLSHEIDRLIDENQELEDLVTLLSCSDSSLMIRKKKVKTQSPDQELLFRFPESGDESSL